MKRILFICSSPYTIFNSINILNDLKEKKDVTADIILFHKTQSISRISKSLKNLGLFNNIYNFSDFQHNRYLKLISLSFIISPLRMIKKLLLEQYEDIQFGYDEVFSQNYFFLTLFSQLNLDAKKYLIEDGTGSYVYKLDDKSERKISLQLVDKFLYKGKLIPDLEGQLLYRPEWIKNNQTKNLQLPEPKIKYIKDYEEAFDYIKNKIYAENRYIIFGDGNMNGLVESKSLPNNMTKYEIIYNYVLPYMQTENSVYRLHPVEQLKDILFINNINIDEYRNLWELECLKQVNNDNVFISFFSTGVMVPKMIYNLETTIILMYKLLNLDKKLEVEYDNLAERLIELYTNKSKIKVVSNISELTEIITKI